MNCNAGVIQSADFLSQTQIASKDELLGTSLMLAHGSPREGEHSRRPAHNYGSRDLVGKTSKPTYKTKSVSRTLSLFGTIVGQHIVKPSYGA